MAVETILAELAEPISAQNPCGVSLDSTQTLVAIEAYRVFGRLTPAANEPDWRQLRKICLDALKESKDLRVLAHFTAASIRIEPLADVLRIFTVVDAWLSRYWDTVHPVIDDDAIMRRNALTLFADRVGIVHALRRMSVVSDQRLGSFSVRDLDIASGVLVQKDPDARQISTELIRGAMTATDSEALRDLSGLVAAAATALQSVETTMLNRAGSSEMVPKLDDVAQTLRRMQEMLAPHIVNVSQGAPVGADTTGLPVSAGREVGSVSSRQDVVRALEAVITYYVSNEPSSLVPIIVERAKRMVTMSFLDSLAEVAPEVVDPVKKAVGVREPSS